jgi:uncharacterized protein YoxC
MNLLQSIPQFTDEVTVSSLPHPISMFLLGIMSITVVFLFSEYRRTKSEVKECRQSIEELECLMEGINKRTDEKLLEVSKKVDSRVDKAILAIKKAQETKK